MRKNYRISFGDPELDESAKKDLTAIIESGWLSEGKFVRKFEERFGEFFGYPYNVALNSGTSGDIAACAALYAHGAKFGDEIIAPALGFVAAGNGIRAAGFTPKFVDIEKEGSLNIDTEQIEEKINDKTRAIMVIHTNGKPAKMSKIMEIANKYNLQVIEDCCEAHGARIDGKYVGSFGDMAIFSFYAAHLIWSVEGGMLSTKSKEIADAVRSIRTHGREPGNLYFQHDLFGLNLRMVDTHAAIALKDLEKFDATFRRRKDNMSYLLDKTKDLNDVAWFIDEDKGEVVAPHAVTILTREGVTRNGKPCDDKDFINYLEENGIQAKRNYGSMPTQHKAFAYLGYNLGQFPNAEYAGNHGAHFGIHQKLTREDLDYASDVLHKYFSR